MCNTISINKKHTFMDLVEYCRSKETVYIQTHNYPDPDAIASAYGLQMLFKYFNVNAIICYVGKNDKINTRKIYDYFDVVVYDYIDIVSEIKEDDYIIYVDSQKDGGNVTDIRGIEIAAIDHHPLINKANYYYKDIRITGSCSSLIAQYYQDCHVPISAEIASLLLYGIKMDTLQLSRGVTELDIKMFYYLFSHSNFELLSRLEKNTLELKDLKAYASAISSIELIDDVGFAAIDFSCPDALIAVVSDFMLSVKEINFAVIYSYREDGIKISVRSEIESSNAGIIVRNALKGIGNGGGHALMAGGLIPAETVNQFKDSIGDEIKKRFINELKKQGRQL